MENILIAPDSFKGSLTAIEAADAIQSGFSEIFPNVNYIKIPMADGGEGTIQALIYSTNGKIKKTTVIDPLGNKIIADYGISGDGKIGIIEMATASGLDKVPLTKRNPMLTTSWGLGDLIKATLNHEVDKIIIGIGGSATNDGGAGMLQSLGGQLLDKNGKQIPHGGKNLHKIRKIDLTNLDPRLEKITIEVAYDVNNPLLGKKGASYVYGPQKGASPSQVIELDKNLTHFSKMIKIELEKDVAKIPGAGAAGGVGAGLFSGLDTKLKQGGKLIAEQLQIEEKIKKADLVITGEGGINKQTSYGKVPLTVAQIAKKYNVPVIAIVGTISKGYEVVFTEGIDAVFSVLTDVTSEEEVLKAAYYNVHLTSRNIASTLSLAK